jgi:hypothetical protein
VVLELLRHLRRGMLGIHWYVKIFPLLCGSEKDLGFGRLIFWSDDEMGDLEDCHERFRADHADVEGDMMGQRVNWHCGYADFGNIC